MSCPTSSMSWPAGASCALAARSSRTSSRRKAMASWRRGGGRPEMAAAVKTAAVNTPADRAPAIAAQWEAGPVLRGGEAPWLSARRRKAMEGVRLIGLPTPRVEPWKYTNLSRLAEIAFAAPANDPLPADVGAADIVLVNGRLRRDVAATADLPPGVTIRGLGEALREDPGLAASLEDEGDDSDAMLALNTPLMTDGVVVTVAPGGAVQRPIHLLSAAQAG